MNRELHIWQLDKNDNFYENYLIFVHSYTYESKILTIKMLMDIPLQMLLNVRCKCQLHLMYFSSGQTSSFFAVIHFLRLKSATQYLESTKHQLPMVWICNFVSNRELLQLFDDVSQYKCWWNWALKLSVVSYFH